MERIKIETEYIKLDQLLKFSGISDTGADAKLIISEGKVKVNGQPELQRGKKLSKGDRVDIEGTTLLIE